MCYGPSAKAQRAQTLLSGANVAGPSKAAFNLAMESRLLQEAVSASFAYPHGQTSVLPGTPESSWGSSPTLNDFGSPQMPKTSQTIPYEVLAALNGDFTNVYDNKNSAAISRAILEANAFDLSPEILDAVSPYLTDNIDYTAMISEALAPGMQDNAYFPDLANLDGQFFDQQMVANAGLQDAIYPATAVKKSEEFEETGSTVEDETETSDEEYHENENKKRSHGGKSSKNGDKAKKPRTRPPNANDILLQTDPEVVQKLLVPVRKRRQAKPVDPDLPPEVVEKRKRNTEAARRSRLRKTLKMDQLERLNDELQAQIDALTAERDEWKQRCEQMQRSFHMQ